MHRKTLFTLAALSATCLLPMSGAMAQDTSTSGLTNTVQDPAQFREDLHQVRELFSQIRENHNLALSTQDRMLASSYQRENKRLHNKALGILDQISMNWQTADIPSLPGETAEMRSSRSAERFGTANGQRYASESEDTAFVRTTVWELRNMLNADKLNGRDPIVSDRMVSMLNAAITRAENPNFRVAWREMNRERLARRIEFSEGINLNIPPASETVREETTTVETSPAIEERTETIERTETTAPVEETTVETVEETTGAASLPQTGGDPGMLVLFGSTLAGLGVVLRRRK